MSEHLDQLTDEPGLILKLTGANSAATPGNIRPRPTHNQKSSPGDRPPGLHHSQASKGESK